MAQARPRKLLGVLWILGAVAVPAITVVFTFVIAAAVGVISNIFVIFTLPVAIFMAKRGRRHFAKVGEKYLEKDSRAPVVFLREFGEEQSILERTSESSAGTFEQKLVDAFETLGPVVAIGRPGENLPPSGSIRLYVDDEHWQAKVRELIERSSLVVIQARGRSEGMFWELDHVFKRVPFKRTMLAFPFQHVLSPRERYLDFRESLEKVTGIQLPYQTSQYIYFESQDTPIAVPAPEVVVAQLAPEAFQKRIRRRALTRMALSVSLAMLGVLLLIVTLNAGEDVSLWFGLALFFYVTFWLSYAALRLKWGVSLLLSLVAVYAVFAYALLADKLPGVSGSDAFGFLGFSLLAPVLAVFARMYLSVKKKRASEGEEEAVVDHNSKERMSGLVRFAVIPIAALAAWLSILGFARAFPLATHLTEPQLLQLAPIQRKMFAAANEDQCEQMSSDPFHRDGYRSVGVEDILKNLGSGIDGYRTRQKVLNTLSKGDIEAYLALSGSAVSQEKVPEEGPDFTGVTNDTAQKISDAGEKERFKAAAQIEYTSAPTNLAARGAFCAVAKTVTRHYPDLPQPDVAAFTRDIGF